MRRMLAAGIATLALTAGSGALTSPATADDDVHPEWGTTSAPNAVLKKSCHDYRYSYDINPPEGDWNLETFIIGPGGKTLFNAAFLGPYDPKQNTARFRICKPSTRFGRFTIKAKLSVQNGDEYVEGWLPPSYFRLHRPRH
jgi:hypothetical protein